VQVEIWSDVVCPWCYIGKRHFEAALARFDHRDEVEVVWRAFELDPSAPARRDEPTIEHLAHKYGMSLDQARAAQDRVTAVAAQDGLRYDLDHAQTGNTFDAHRLIHLALVTGGPALQDAVKERLLAAYFTEREAIGDHDTLVRLVGEAGLDEAAARAVLDSDRYGDQVRSDERDAQQLGVTGVPFFVVDRAYGASGAQPADDLLALLDTAWAAAHPVALVTGGGSDEACDADGCPI
jgi:predicted DsbA family dithiol-disulfide isomerase